MQAQAKMAGAMGSTAKVMAATNKQLKIEDIQKTMMGFEQESAKMDMAGEMSKLHLSSLFMPLLQKKFNQLFQIGVQGKNYTVASFILYTVILKSHVTCEVN